MYRERMASPDQHATRFDLRVFWRRASPFRQRTPVVQWLRPALVVCVTLVIFAIGYVAFRAAQTDKAVPAVTSLVSGDVRVGSVESPVRRSARAPGETAQSGTLEAGDTVLTGANSSLKITFFDHSTAFVGAETEVAVQKLNRRSRDYRIVLAQQRGRISVNVEAARGDSVDFSIETPSALVQVTGTRFTVVVGDDGSTEVVVEAGMVLVTAAATSRTVAAGERILIRYWGAPEGGGAIPVPPVPEAQPTAGVTRPAPAVEKERERPPKPERPAQADESPGNRHGAHSQPTRRPAPEQAPPQPTKKPLPTHVPPPTKGQPPGLEHRPNLENHPARPARP
jgi:hypothetical protein